MDKLTPYDPDLPKAKGWGSLPEAKKKRMQGFLSDAVDSLAGELFFHVKSGLTFVDAERELKGTDMGITDFMEVVFKEKSSRQGFTRKAYVEQLIKNWGEDNIRKIASGNGEIFRNYRGYRLGDLVPISEKHRLSAHASDEKIDSFFNGAFLEEVKKARSRHRRAPDKITHDEEDAAIMIFRFADLRINQIRGAETPTQKRAIWKRVSAALFESQDIPGKLVVKRGPIPDGWPAQVGGPRTTE